MKCRICGSTDNHKSLKLQEMMYGTSEEFDYFICCSCKCIQISSIPSDLHQYYPLSYYSFHSAQKTGIKTRIKQKYLNFRSFIKGDFYQLPDFAVLGILYTDRKKAILDIGCGDGSLLFKMKCWGFLNLTGIDPFIENNYSDKRIKLLKIHTEKLEGQFDIIMSHHSLEHMSDPNLFFSFVNKHLKPEGKFILRIPIYPNYIWEKYSTRWIQLDPPRHLYTFSIKAIEHLCKKNMLIINNIIYDSHAWALASTEFCKNNYTHKEFEKNVIITAEQYSACRVANERKKGDSVCITISKK